MPAAAALPRRHLGGPRGARRDRGHVGPVPLPRHPVGLGHVHPRLPVPAVAGGVVDRVRGGDPRLRAPDRPRARGERAHPLRPAGRAARLELGRRAVDGHHPHPRRPGAAHRPVRLPRDRLLLLRVGPPRGLPRPGGVRRRGRAPAALARGDAGRGPPRRGRRQRRHRHHPAPRPRRRGRVRGDDAPAQPQLRRVAAVARRGRRRAARRAAGCRGAPPRARQERAALDRRLPGAAPPPGGRPAAAAPPGAAPPARRLPRRHPLRAPLRPLGPAAVRGPRRRPVRGAVRRTGPSGDRHRRAVRARRHPAGVGRAGRGRRHRDGDRPGDADRGRGRARRRRRAGRPVAAGTSTRG